MDNKTINKTFPKSVKGNQCIGSCYPPNERILHPTVLTYISNEKKSFANDAIHLRETGKPFCPIQPWRDRLGVLHIFDNCSTVTSSTDIDKKIIQDFIIPKIQFDPIRFLTMYYNIRSLDDAVLWYTNNQSVPYKTIERIMNCALKVYGEEELYNRPVSDAMMDFTKYMISEYWMNDFLHKLSPMITLIKNKSNEYELIIKSDMDEKYKEFNNDEKLFLKNTINELLTNLLLRRILKKCYEHYKTTWNTSNSHLLKVNKIAYYFIRRKLLQK